MPALPPHESAAREAFEEAGVLGRINDRSVGFYSYEKRSADGTTQTCLVDVFLLEVDEQKHEWPEQGERETRWFSAREAAAMVREPELRALIQNMPSLIE